jgi:serine/threonine-protein kinase
MAPEQAIGARIIDHRADIWSLGVILYECLSGARPVEGENAAQMVMRLLSTGIIPIGHLVPGLPADLEHLVGRMLAREPARRPSDLREVLAVLAPIGHAAVPAFEGPRTAPPAAPTPAEDAPAVSPFSDFAPLSPGPPRRERPAMTGSLDRLSSVAPPVAGSRPSWSRWRWPIVLATLTAAALAWSGVRVDRRAVPDATAPRESASSLGAAQLGVARGSTEGVAVGAGTESLGEAGIAEAGAPPSIAPGPALSVGEPRAVPLQPPLRKPPAAPARDPAPARDAAPNQATERAPAAPSSLPRGAPCDRSRDCSSTLCLAFVCE